MTSSTTKTCIKCNEPKPLDQFRGHRGQLVKTCLECRILKRKLAQASNWQDNPDRFRGQAQVHYLDPGCPFTPPEDAEALEEWRLPQGFDGPWELAGVV